VNKRQENKSKILEIQKFTKIEDTHLFEYSHKNGDISIINYFHKTCTCSFFNDRAMCVHLIRVATLEKDLFLACKLITSFLLITEEKN
jgi:hypothetical protein